MNLPNSRVIKISKRKAFVIYPTLRKGKKYLAKYFGKMLFCKKCKRKYFILNTTYKRNKRNGYCSKCCYKGKNSGNWNGGKRITNHGYIEVKALEHPFRRKSGYVAEHRLKIERKLKRFLLKSEVVHHKDGNKLNNKVSNLILFPNEKEHKKYHRNILNGRFQKI